MPLPSRFINQHRLSRDQPMSNLPSAPPTRTRWMIFALACGVSFLLYLHRFTWAVAKRQIGKEFGWDITTLSYFDSAFMLSYAVGQIPGGILADWFGSRSILTVMIVVWTIGLAGTACAWNFISMVFVRLFFGLGQAGCYPNLNKVSKAWFPPDVRTAVQGWISSFSGRMGGAASYMIFATVCLGYFSMPWRNATLLFALLGFAGAGIFWIWFRNSPFEHPLCNSAEAALIVRHGREFEPVKKSRLNWRQAVRSFNLWMLVFQQFTCAFVDMVFSSWVPFFLVEQAGVDISNAGWMAALPLMGGAIGGMTGATFQNELIRRSGSRKWSRRGIGFTGNLMATILMLLMVQMEGKIAIVVTFILLKFFADWSQPTTWATATDIAGPNSASVFAIINTSGSAAGIVSSPIMAGIVDYFSGGDPKSSTGWSVLFGTLSAIYLASAISWLWIDCERPIESPTDEPGDRA